MTQFTDFMFNFSHIDLGILLLFDGHNVYKR